MRSIVYDEITAADLEKVRGHLAAACQASPLPDVFWLNLPTDLLTPVQFEHGQCRPHRVSIVLDAEEVRLELLVRSAGSLRCECTGYTNQAQRDFCLKFMDNLCRDLDIKT